MAMSAALDKARRLNRCRCRRIAQHHTRVDLPPSATSSIPADAISDPSSQGVSDPRRPRVTVRPPAAPSLAPPTPSRTLAHRGSPTPVDRA